MMKSLGMAAWTSAIVTSAGLASLMLPVAADGQQAPASAAVASATDTVLGREAAEVDAYWTADRLRGARPLDLPTPRLTGPGGLPQGAQLATPVIERPKSAGAAVPGGPPTTRGTGAQKRLMPPTLDNPTQAASAGDRTSVQGSSSYGAYFTTSRVFPDAATVTYPYSTAGKLFFRNPRTSQDFVCSASVLRARVVVTAGHCVTSPSTDAANRFFYTNFLFVPAFNNGSAPFGSWTSGQQFVLPAWYLSNGSVPNPGDVAFLVMSDRSVSGAMRKIAEVTGYLGYWTLDLAKNHVTMLGYPCNLDACQRMQATDAGSFADGGNNTEIYGSAARGGASGGPWIQDFGVNPASNPAVSLGGNFVVGVTSYGPVATEPKYLGASIFDNNFLAGLNSACAGSGNC